MFDKTLDQMQNLGKQWAQVGRKMTREALQATSTSLESAARYLEHLGSRLDRELESPGAAEAQPEAAPAGSEGEEKARAASHATH